MLSIKLSLEPTGQEKYLTVSESTEPWFLSHGTLSKREKKNKEVNWKLSADCLGMSCVTPGLVYIKTEPTPSFKTQMQSDCMAHVPQIHI